MKNRLLTVQILLVGLVITVLPSQTNADDGHDDAEVQIDAGASTLVGPWSMVCEKDYDVISCVTPTILPDAILGMRYRKGSLAIGGLASLGRLHSSEIMNATMWRVALEGRYFSHVGEVLDHWFALELGMVGAYSESEAWNPYAAEPWIEKELELGPEIGVGTGLDFQMGDHFAVGFSMRLLWLGFFELDRTDEWDDALMLYKTIWFVMGAHIRFSFPRT